MWNRIHRRPHQMNRIPCMVDLHDVQTNMDDTLDYVQSILLEHQVLLTDVAHVFELYNPTNINIKAMHTMLMVIIIYL